VLFELVPAPLEEKPSRTGNARLCLGVSDVAAALQDLKSKGVATKEIVDKSDGILGSFEDPDGNELCLWQYRTK
jgi:predicted enzyme related to lactoylglutathione lyase